MNPVSALPRGRLSPFSLGAIAAILVFLADQASKYWIIEIYAIAERGPVRLLPFLDLVMAWNKGVSYGRFQLPPLALFAFSIAACLFLIVWMWRTPDRLTCLALGLITGGALGNALDRITHGAVADFFDFHTPFWLGPLSNYVFNVADVGIVAGAGLLLYEAFTNGKATVIPPE